LPWSEPSPRSSTPGSGRAYRRAEPRPDVPRQRTACGARPAPSDRPADGTDRRFARRTPDTRHCDAASSGVGKSWLACALGHKACREDFSVLYHRIPRLFTALAPARGDGRYAKLLRTLARVELLILDHWGPEQLNAEQRRDLLEIVEDRYDARSIIITSQLPVERWYEIIGNPTPSWIASSTTPTESNSPATACESSRSAKRRPRLQCPQRKCRKTQAHPHLPRQKRTGNDRRARLAARPGGSTGFLPRAPPRRLWGTPRRARVPPVDYRDGLLPCLINEPLRLTRTKIENIIPTTRGDSARWPASNRNYGRLQIGTGGRLHIGMHGRLRRNPQTTPLPSQASPRPELS
jgi:IstB-like ATP binding protein